MATYKLNIPLSELVAEEELVDYLCQAANQKPEHLLELKIGDVDFDDVEVTTYVDTDWHEAWSPWRTRLSIEDLYTAAALATGLTRVYIAELEGLA